MARSTISDVEHGWRPSVASMDAVATSDEKHQVRQVVHEQPREPSGSGVRGNPGYGKLNDCKVHVWPCVYVRQLALLCAANPPCSLLWAC